MRLLRSEPRGGLGWGLTLSRFFHTDSQPYAAHAARCVPANSEQGPAAHASSQAWRRGPRSGLRAQEAEALGAGGAACARNPTCFPGLLLSQSSPPPVAPHFSTLSGDRRVRGSSGFCSSREDVPGRDLSAALRGRENAAHVKARGSVLSLPKRLIPRARQGGARNSKGERSPREPVTEMTNQRGELEVRGWRSKAGRAGELEGPQRALGCEGSQGLGTRGDNSCDVYI